MERERVFLIGVMAIIMNGMRLTALADAPDTLFFEAKSDTVLSTDSIHPTTLFAGTLDDYEPAYAYFDSKSSSGSRFFINREISLEILRPYNIIRTSGEMTVQFQGVTRTHANPHTASITVKFTQSGENIVAYTMRAAALKPLDIELGLDLDAMVDAQNPRAEARPLTGDVRDAGYNICAVAMRKPAAAIERVVQEGDSISDTFAGNGAVSVTHAAADTAEYNGYLPNNSWVDVALNHSLADLDEVEGSYHYGANTSVRQTAYNLKYTIVSDRLGEKTCQFQRQASATSVTGVLVEFRQNGDNVQAKTSQYRTYYIYTTNYVNGVLVSDYYSDRVHVGMDFEKFSTKADASPRLQIYNTYATEDSSTRHGVKDLKLKFRSRATTIRDGYMPNLYDEGIAQSWRVVATNQTLSDLVGVDAFYHTGKNTGHYVSCENLKISGNSGSCQFQRAMDSGITCIILDLRQNGGNVEGSTGRYRNFYMYYVQNGVSYSNEVFYGTDFYSYSGSTLPKRTTYGSYGAEDSAAGGGIKNLRLRFATGGVIYAAASTAPFGNDLTFAGSADMPLAVRTVAATTFPSNGVVTVAPYADLAVSSHVVNSRWTQYRVLTNGTLRLKGTKTTAPTDQFDLVGGTLSIREDESGAVSSESYINYVTLMDGACVRGKFAQVLHDSQQANWIVAGDSPSTCESGLLITAAGGDIERTFTLNVKDVTGNAQPDFFVSGDIVDYGTMTGGNAYWNVHVVKAGAGTMELSGGVTLPNEICVSNGAVRIAEGCTFGVSRKRSTENGDGSEKTAEIWLAGGALETAADATNTIGKVVAKVKDAQLNLGNGSKLTLAGFDFDNGANLLVSDNLGKGATLRIEGLTDVQRVRIRCGADRLRVREDANGNLEPYAIGFQMSIK